MAIHSIRTRHTLALAAAAGVAAAVLSVPSPASAHGVSIMPGSRTNLCYKDLLQNSSTQMPSNPACADAVRQTGTTPLYNWFRRSGLQRRWQGRGLRPGRKAVQCGRPQPVRLLRVQRGPHRLAEDAPDLRGDHPAQVQQLGRPSRQVRGLPHQERVEPEPGPRLGRPGPPADGDRPAAEWRCGHQRRPLLLEPPVTATQRSAHALHPVDPLRQPGELLLLLRRRLRRRQR